MSRAASPPWETRPPAQVPYLDASSPALSEAERRALPDLWATRNHSFPRHRPSTSDGRKSSYYHQHVVADTNYLHGGPAPYETHVYIPPGPATAPPVPNIARVATPDDSPRPSETVSSDGSSSAPGSPIATQHTVIALPGTMSSRSKAPARQRSKPGARNATSQETPESGKFGKRFRTAFKDIFKRNAVDESQYEELPDRHWTEED